MLLFCCFPRKASQHQSEAESERGREATESCFIPLQQSKQHSLQYIRCFLAALLGKHHGTRARERRRQREMGFGGVLSWMIGKLKQGATVVTKVCRGFYDLCSQAFSKVYNGAEKLYTDFPHAFHAAAYLADVILPVSVRGIRGGPIICRIAQYALRSLHGGMGSGQIEELQDRIEELEEDVKLQTKVNKFLVERIQLSESSSRTLCIGSNIEQKPEDAVLGSNMEQKPEDVILGSNMEQKPEDVFLGSNMEQKSDVFMKPEDVSLGCNMDQKPEDVFLGSNMEQKPEDVFTKPEDVSLGANMERKPEDVFMKLEDVSLGSNMEQKPEDVFMKPEDVFLGSNMEQKPEDVNKDFLMGGLRSGVISAPLVVSNASKIEKP